MPSSIRSSVDVLVNRVLRRRQPGHLAYGGQATPEAKPGVIALCVLVSVLAWFMFSLQRSYTTVVQMPTRVVNLPENQALRNPAPTAISVQMQGSGLELIQIRSRPPVLELDAVGDQIVLDETLLDLQLNVTGISPRVIDLDKERRVTKAVPVYLDADITLPPTFGYLVAPRMMPDSILISGAASIVNPIRAWPTERFEIVGLRDSIRMQVALADTLSGLVMREANEVEVAAHAVEFTEGSRQLEVRVEGTTNIGGRPPVELDPSSIIVRYRVPLAQYNAARQANDFFATVTLDEIQRDTTGRVTPQIQYPEGIIIRDPIIGPPSTLRSYNVLVDN
ncbi:MAG: hypothetical protein RhofKO_42070 [Rhodothermales bacterium]